MQQINAGRYNVLVGAGLIDKLGALVEQTPIAGAACIAIVSDSNVAPLYAERVRSALTALARSPRIELFVVPAGESSKSRREWALLTDAMLARNLGRDAAVLTLGGGVVGDLGGFVAATYSRGIPVVHVPTSLLAMVDSSIGGKTGVDTPAGKNLVGAFHWPALVVADVSVLATLPLQHWRAGFAEVLKHGAIASDDHFRRAAAMGKSLPNVDAADLVPLIADSIRIKAQIVAADERESGQRRSLNVGHTLAHAFEHASQFQMLHGEAVSIGLVLESEIGERIGVTAPGTAAQLRSALSGAGLPVTVPRYLIPIDVLAATRSDKKARDGRVEYSLLARVGAADEAHGRFSRAVRDTDVTDVLQTFSAS